MRLVWEGDVAGVYTSTRRCKVVIDFGLLSVFRAADDGGWYQLSHEGWHHAQIMAFALRSSLARATHCRDMACAAQQGLARGGDPASLLQALIRACIDGPQESA